MALTLSTRDEAEQARDRARLDAVLDSELARYAVALERLGE